MWGVRSEGGGGVSAQGSAACGGLQQEASGEGMGSVEFYEVEGERLRGGGWLWGGVWGRGSCLGV